MKRKNEATKNVGDTRKRTEKSRANHISRKRRTCPKTPGGCKRTSVTSSYWRREDVSFGCCVTGIIYGIV